MCAPPTLIPKYIEKTGVKVTYDIKEALKDADVAIALRIQLERQNEQFFPSLREYAMNFGIDREKLESAKKGILIMHPGPINRGVELASDVANGPYSVILDQVTNGIATRMAVLYLVTGAGGEK